MLIFLAAGIFNTKNPFSFFISASVPISATFVLMGATLIFKLVFEAVIFKVRAKMGISVVPSNDSFSSTDELPTL